MQCLSYLSSYGGDLLTMLDRLGKRTIGCIVLPLAIMVGLAHGQEEGTLARGRSQPEARVIRPAFHDPRPVAVDGYDDHVMEPFLTRDGKFLQFTEPIEAIRGFVEAPTLPPDERTLYYHKRNGERFVLECVSR
jgi:hypothetical protein